MHETSSQPANYINLSKTPLPDAYKAEGYMDLPSDLNKRLRDNLRFDGIPTDRQMRSRIKSIVAIADEVSKEIGCKNVVIGAPGLFIAPLERALTKAGYKVFHHISQKEWGGSNAEYLHYGTREIFTE